MDQGQPRLTRADQIVLRMTELIAAGTYKVGSRLPSVRQAAWEHGVSKNTVAEAYDRLVAQGLVEAKLGSGYYVAHAAAGAQPAAQPHVEAAVDLASLLREQLDQHYEVRPGDGRPPASWMEGSELRRHFAGFKSLGAESINYGYGSSWGNVPLRERLCLTLADRSINVAPEGVLMTHGANHALDLIIRHLLEPGDTVFVDDPGYYPLFAKLTLAKVKIVGIRRLGDGPDLDDLAAKAALHRPRLFFTQSQAHNPTGAGLTPANAFGLLQLAERWGFRVVEDDAFGDLLPPALPRLAALDQLDRVIYVGSFAKTLSASLRSGFVAGHPATIAALADIKMLTTVATSDHVERFIFNLMTGGQYLRHLRRLRSRLAEATTKSTAALENLGLKFAVPRVPGFYLWLTLPDGIDELNLCRAAARESVFLAPGRVFHPGRDTGHPQALRINVAHGADPRFTSFMQGYLRDAG